MKKILSILIILVTVSALSATTGSLVYEHGGAENTNATAELTYTLTTKPSGDPDVPVVNTYRIGFSTKKVQLISDEPADETSLTLEVGNDFIGRIKADTYVYWKIASPVSCEIYLKPSSMKGTDTQSNNLHINFSTSTDGLAGDCGTAYGVENTGEALTDENVGASPNSTEERTTGLEKPICDYNAGENNNYQFAGCQLLKIETNNIAGLAPDTYTGKLVLTIKATE